MANRCSSYLLIAASLLVGLGTQLMVGATSARDAQSPAKTEASLCQAGETVLFQCRLKRASAAVCSGKSTGGLAHIEYRHGKRGSLDFTYPTLQDGPNVGFHRARVMYSGGGEVQIIFTRNGYRYVVYSRVTRTGFGGGHNNPRFEAGVGVIRGNH